MIGPFRGGRTRAVAGVPGDPTIFYMGQVNGGVWKSNDYGRTWAPIFDQQPTQSIGAIAVAPSDPNTIYVGSGEGLHRPDLSVGNGVYKSTDAGKTWTHLGLDDAQQIPAMAVDPHDPNRVFTAVLGHPYGPNEERGVYRSSDGGTSWKKVLYKDENTGASDVEMDPSNPNIVYACLWEVREGPWEDRNIISGSGGGLFKSTDGGETWKQLTNGLPKDIVQLNLAISPSQPNRLYLVFGTLQPGGYASGAGMGFYRSDDAGETWYKATDDARPMMRIGGGDLPMTRVDPKNPDVVYATGIVTVRSTDGGKTWMSIRGAPGGDDYQNLWINPQDPKMILLVSDQGGIVTVNGGETWSSWYNQPTAQMYHVAATNTFPYRVCGGQQESGSLCISSRGNDGVITFRDWHPVGVIEYGYAAPDPLDSDIIYGGGRTEVSKYHLSTGQIQNVTPVPVRNGKYRANRTEPVMFSPLDSHTLYYATNILFKTRDGGNSWQAISPDLTRPDPGAPPSIGTMLSKKPEVAKIRGVIYALAPSVKDINTLWAGTDDGLIWNTRDGGKNWNNITPPELTAWSKVTQLDASHFDDQSAYASISRFRIDDLRPYIYRTHDGGKTWQLIVNGLPSDAPVDSVREDPVRKGLLFAGTEKSVWVSFDDGDHWQSLQLNLPHTSMRDLIVKDNDLILGTHGRSIWILDDITSLRQIASTNADTLFKPGPAYRVRRSTNTDTPIPPDEPLGENPPDGAIIDYFLSQAASGPVTLELHDSKGNLVRRFASTDRPEQTEEELSKQLIPLYWLKPFKAPSSAQGIHRWVWDLHYPSPISTEHQYPISAVPMATPRHPLGPRALPGQYEVTLTANGKNYSAPLTVKMDPRVKITAAELQQQFDLQTRLASLLSQSSEISLHVQSLREQLDSNSEKANAATRDSIEALKKKLKELTDGAGASKDMPQPTLSAVHDAANSLYAEVDRADAAPTIAQVAATKTAESQATQVVKQWELIKAQDVAAVNKQFQDTGLPQVNLEARPKTQPDGGDED